jgi:hypothetical protein
MLACAACLAGAAAASTPIPNAAVGSGSEPTAGGGIISGKPFVARYALAQLDISFDQLEIYLLPSKLACNDTFFAKPPFVVVTVDSAKAPLVVGRPSLENGVAFVQVDFHPPGSKYYSIQPGASITITRVDPKPGGMWHGRLTVKRQRSDGKVFSYSGTFAARWCGKD